MGSLQEFERFFSLLIGQHNLSIRKGLLPEHLWQQAYLIHASSPVFELLSFILPFFSTASED